MYFFIDKIRRMFGQQETEMKSSRVSNNIKAVRDAWKHDAFAMPKLSEGYRQKLELFEKGKAEKEIPSRGFRLTVPLQKTKKNIVLKLEFDGVGKKWYLQKGEERTPIEFDGFISAADIHIQEKGAADIYSDLNGAESGVAEIKSEIKTSAGLSIILDQDNNKFRLVTAEPILNLREPEPSPGQLVIWKLKHQHQE